MHSLDGLAKVNVLVIGDVILDRYWWGSVNRISPEAPVPVVDLKKCTYAPGGAANVAANIAGLGATAYLVSSMGTDAEGEVLIGLLTDLNISTRHLVRTSTRQTSIKTRIIAHSQQVVRVDHETTSAYSEHDHTLIWSQIASVLPKVDVVIVSDYAKGLLSEELLSKLIETARAEGKMLFVDPKGKDYSRYAGSTLLTPNRREAAEAVNLSEHIPDMVTIAGNQLLEDIKVQMVLITQGEDGMTLFEKGKDPVHLSSIAKEIYDVTGAGDTVIACIGAALGAGISFRGAAELANTAAGLVVEQVGTTAITRDMLDGYKVRP